MKPDGLARLLRAYRDIAVRAGMEFECLDPKQAGVFSPFRCEADTENNVTIRIQGPLDHWYGTSAEQVIRALDDAQPASIKVLIESPGGFVSEGLALYSDLRARSKAGVAVTTETRGVVASAAVLPFLAGDTRYMGDGSLLMIHNPWTFAFFMGDESDIRKGSTSTINALTANRKECARITATRTGMAIDKVTSAMNDETWYSADEAISAGYAIAAPDADEGVPDEDMKLMALAHRRIAAEQILREHRRG